MRGRRPRSTHTTWFSIFLDTRCPCLVRGKGERMGLELVVQALKVQLALVVAMCAATGIHADEPVPGERIVLIGNGLAHRMQYFPHFETQLHRQFPNSGVVMRNLGRPGDTSGFRPHASRETPWAFPGAELFHPGKQHRGEGQFPSPDEWLSELQADTIFAFFGFNESFEGELGLANFRAELTAFVEHTLSRSYNGESPPRLILVSPTPFEDLSATRALPDGVRENERLSAYTDTIAAVATDMNVEFVDVFSPMLSRYEFAETPLTINGFSLTGEGYRALAAILRSAVYGEDPQAVNSGAGPLYDAVKDKNWHWLNDYGMLNDIHVYGRRVEPFGVENYPEEIIKIRQMTTLRDARIHELARGADAAPVNDEAQTLALSEIETNFNLPIEFLDVQRAIDRFELPEGFEIDLFASESEFPELRNPVQMSFDNRGRLWVAVAPSYPHWRPGDDKPDDKLLIFDDADRDGRADSVSVFADGLHLPFGFELASEGVYLAQQPNLVLLADDDGDGRADRREILLHGFDSHDSHHAISAFAADASGAIYMSEGVFLHSQVETPYGPQRGVDGGVWRFDPRTWRLERFIQTSFSNPWGFVFDEWDQPFVADASPGDNWWGLPLSVRTLHGGKTTKYAQFTT
ncbi:MAG: dehydrogenase, partial [Proteobacteria bacterium]|nr:dehydrogenase [Pseudomonadota bacterium]